MSSHSVSGHSLVSARHPPPTVIRSSFSAEVLGLEQDRNLLEAPDDSVCWAQWLWVGPEVALSVGLQALLMVWSGLPF